MMNERIKQLAYQAMNFAEAIHGRFHEEHDPPNWDTFDAYEQKFAELIVRECLTLIDDKIADLDSYAAGEDEFIARSLGAYQAKEVIMDHFGVE